jgi:hypothetical protein
MAWRTTKPVAKIVESGTPVAVLPALPPEGQADPWLERAKPVFDDILDKIMALARKAHPNAEKPSE